MVTVPEMNSIVRDIVMRDYQLKERDVGNAVQISIKQVSLHC